MIQADAQGCITDCNKAVMRLMHKNELPLGQRLDAVLRAADGSALDIEFFTAECPALPQVIKLRNCEDLFKALCVGDDGACFVLAERIGETDSPVMQAMSALTNDLVNIGRDLARKNRELAEAKNRIEAISRIDALTGLTNRRYFMERYTEALSLADRHRQPLSLLMADLDHFKQVNDAHGHDAGDRVLAAFAQVLSATCRKEDLAARFGGEEFVLMLPMTEEEDALRVGLRICATMRGLDVLERGQPVTVSIGVAMQQPGESADELLRRADQALYRAKNAGRNQVRGSQP